MLHKSNTTNALKKRLIIVWRCCQIEHASIKHIVPIMWLLLVGYGTTNADTGVGIGMLKGGFRNLIKKAINNSTEF